MPKEHGSWGMFYIPMLLGFLTAGAFSAAGALLFIAATAAFLSREPFMEWWRLYRRNLERRHERRLLTLALLATLTGAALLAQGRVWLLPMAVAGAAVIIWQSEAAMRGRGRSVTTEITAIATSTLVAPAAYYTVTTRLDASAALTWLLSAAYFASAVFYVKMRVTAAHGRSPEQARRNCAVYHAILTASLFALPPLAAAGFLPIITRAFVGVLRPTKALNLKRIGWTEVLYSLIWLTLTALALRPSSSVQ